MPFARSSRSALLTVVCITLPLISILSVLIFETKTFLQGATNSPRSLVPPVEGIRFVVSRALIATVSPLVLPIVVFPLMVTLLSTVSVPVTVKSD